MNPLLMDRELLGSYIRYKSHILDISNKGLIDDEELLSKVKKDLLRSLHEWSSRKYEETPDILWANRLVNETSFRKRELKTNFETAITYDQLMKLIKNRRSVRIFTKKIPEKQKILQIVETGIWAPCSCNRQAWKFIVSKTPFVSKRVLAKAPISIYIAIDTRMYFKEKFSAAMDAAVAIQNMLLAAHVLGMGGCYVYLSEFADQRKLRDLLDLPSYYNVYAAVALGYPAETPVPPPRRPLEKVINFVRTNLDFGHSRIG